MHQVDSREDYTEKDSSFEVLMLLKQQIQGNYRTSYLTFAHFL